MGAMSDAATSAALFDEVVQLRAERTSLEAGRDATAKRDAQEFALRSEAPGDPWEMVRHLEEQCRLFIRERDEWKAVADRDRAARLAAEAENTRLKETMEAAANLVRRQQEWQDYGQRLEANADAAMAKELTELRQKANVLRDAALAAEAENACLKETVEAMGAALKLAENPLSYRNATDPNGPGSVAVARALDTVRSVLATIPPKENPDE